MIKFKLLFFLSILSSLVSAQKLPSTLLWKITGNGFEKPCYLYGTIHLTDERIFNLGDSLYSAIESSEGFAIEIDPNEITELLIDYTKSSIIERRRIKDMMNEKSFKKYSSSLSKKLNKNPEDITTEDVFREKNKWIKESYEKGTMKTFLDAYLYDVARRLGKWTGGIEELDDQKGVLNLMVDESDLSDISSDEDDDSSPGFELLIKYYLANNLNAIDSLSGLNDSLYNDALLIKRNIKMSRRMDSLGHIRSMVFAVGAAHLPGSGGVIELLKKRGFTVTPVFSSKKIKSRDYAIVEKPLPWYEVKDDDGYYTASMPGKPGNVLLYGVMNMKMFFEIFNSTIYLSTATYTPYSQHMADSIFKEMTTYYFGSSKTKKEKSITINNVPGKEIMTKEGKYTRAMMLFKNGIMYLAIGMSTKNDDTGNKSVDKFIESFQVQERAENMASSFVTYADTLKAYSLEVPAQPKKANDLSESNDESLISDLNVCLDPNTGAYLFFGVNEVTKGYYIENDSLTLANIIESQRNKLSAISDTFYTKNGHKVLEFSGASSSSGLFMRTYYEFRGNRWYALVAVYDESKKSTSIDRFFSSFRLLDYPVTKWEQHSSDDHFFTAWAPSTFEYKQTSADDATDAGVTYEAFDTVRRDGFFIIPQSFNKYYWENSDSAFWQSVVSAYTNYSDTMLSKKEIHNGDSKGIEIIVQPKGSGNLSRKRILLNGNKIYTLTTMQATSEIFNENNNKFFESFRFTKTEPSNDIFVSKSAQLLKALGSDDSTVRAEAIDFLDDANFTENDIPLLHEALLKQYQKNEDSYLKTNETIRSIIISFKHASSFAFAQEHYATANDEQKSLLLDIMSSFPTKENFDVIKNFLLHSHPRKELGYNFINHFTDTLELAAGLFPDLLVLLKDTITSTGITIIAETLLDNNLLSISALKPYEQNLLSISQINLKALKADSENYHRVNSPLIHILSKINTPATNNTLQLWAGLKDQPYLQLEAISGLLANGQVLSPQLLQLLAADKTTRTDLFEQLKKYKKQILFPRQYFTQKHFAESYIYIAAADDDEPSELTYLTQKVLSFQGKQARFFFYKVTYGEEGDESYMLACAGPFSTNEKELAGDEATADLYYDEDFDSTVLPQQMDALITQMEDWFKPPKSSNN